MIKILSIPKWIINCPKCECEFECEKMDFQIDKKYNDYFIECPQCKTKIGVCGVEKKIKKFQKQC